MADPFEALREPVIATAPDPLFAAHLRARLSRALALPKGVTVSNLTLESEDLESPDEGAASLTSPETTITPYLIVAGARRALDWYAEAMGAAQTGEPIVMADGRIGHAELRLGGATIYLADESPQSRVAAPQPDEDARVSLTLTVPDVDGLVARSVGAGAELERPAADYDYGRNAVIRDPFGHRWIVSSLPMRAQSPRVKEGDVAYVSLWVPDGERAATFFASVLGWTYGPAADRGRARQVLGLSLPHGIFGGQQRSTLFLCFWVADLDEALAQVRATGGQAEAPTDEPYGRTAGCVDNQGVRFALVEMGDEPGARGPVNGSRHGDISYLTMHVVDSALTRAFYGSVLGWHFNPGRVDDGWGPDDVVPMLGLHGGHDQATVLPMYRVDDIAAAVARVRAAGGTSTDAEQQPYGLTAECVDDQGTHFYLGQH